MAKTNQQKQPRRGPDPVVISVQNEAPTTSATGDTWSVLVTTIISQGGQTLSGRTVQFYTNSQPEGNPVQTDANGRVSCLIHTRSTVKQLTVETQVVGTPALGRVIVQSPEKKADEKPIPTELLVDTRRVGNTVHLFIRVTDQRNKNIPRAKLTIADSSQTNLLTQTADDDGEYYYSFTLIAGEEREVSIYAAGYGEKGFRRTFRGKEIIK